jgi:2-amino-4-hydroxy-6-hydroxymethyldihydropteridine diphosphokinase
MAASDGKTNHAVIGVGSNIEPRKNIAAAIAELASGQRLVGQSRFVWTKPIGPAEQPDFLNGAVRIETALGRAELKRWLKALETRLGRTCSRDKFGPRTIDLDIVVWNGRVVNEDYHARDFVRRAVMEVWPEQLILRP